VVVVVVVVFLLISLKRLLVFPRRFHRKARKTVDMVLSLLWSSSSSLFYFFLFVFLYFDILMEFRKPTTGELPQKNCLLLMLLLV